MASESERKYDEISRRLGVVQEVTTLTLIFMITLMLRLADKETLTIC